MRINSLKKYSSLPLLLHFLLFCIFVVSLFFIFPKPHTVHAQFNPGGQFGTPIPPGATFSDNLPGAAGSGYCTTCSYGMTQTSLGPMYTGPGCNPGCVITPQLPQCTTPGCGLPPVGNTATCGSSCIDNSQCANATNGCTYCVQGVCTNTPYTPPQGPACGTACSSNLNCAGAQNGCTNCVGGVCTSAPPGPACGTTCSRNADCAGARNGCNSCIGGTCRTQAACGVSCNFDSDCAGARDGCTSCVGGQCKTPPACGVTCSRDSDCAGAKDGCSSCIAGVCKTPEACGTSCVQDGDCAGAKDGCTSCVGGQCKQPAACGVSCTKNADCQAAKDGCTSCIGGQCKTPACGASCTKDSECAGAKDGCNTCIQGSCQTFNTGMCTCDGIQATDIASGQPVSITDFEKVVGADITKAKVKDMTFYLTKNNTVIAKSALIPAVIDSQTSNKVRYKATWTVTMPSQVDRNADYRFFTMVDCVKNDPLAYAPNQSYVMGAQTQATTNNGGILAEIMNFFSALFGGGSANKSNTNSSPIALVNPVTPTPNKSQNNSLQIGTFIPASNIQNSCRFIKFDFGKQQ